MNPIKQIEEALIDLVRDNQRPTKILVSYDFYCEALVAAKPGLYARTSAENEKLLGLPFERNDRVETFRIVTAANKDDGSS